MFMQSHTHMYQITGSNISGSYHNDWCLCITVCSRA